MRILSIEFENLNALYGRWQIDFTDPAYQDNGLFAITGPTGAGKSTILDAISLALYGKTPRLSSIATKQNDLMSLDSTQCFAEVRYETSQGIFRNRWSQRKSKNQKLQTQSHEITHENGNPDGKVLASSIREVAKITEEKTGLDFERFTQTVLLPQGKFADFLMADADKRTLILEEITGTHLYSHISVKVHELYKIEYHKAEKLKQGLDTQSLLTPEQAQALVTQAQDIKKQQDELRQGLAQKQQAIEHWQTLNATQAELKEKQVALIAVQNQQTSFAPHQQRLILAESTRVLLPIYTQLKHERQTSEAIAQEIKNKTNAQDELNQQQTIQQNLLTQAKTQLQTTQQEKDSLDALLKTVRQTDNEIKLKQAAANTANSQYQAKKAQWQSIQKELTQCQQQYQAINDDIHTITQTLEDLAFNPNLSQKIPVWHEQIQALKKVATDIEDHQKELTQKRDNLNELSSKLSHTQGLVRYHEAQLAKVDDEKKRLQQDLDKANQIPDTWISTQASRSSLQQQKDQQQHWLKQIDDYETSQDQWQHWQQALLTTEQKIADTSQLIKQLEQTLATTEQDKQNNQQLIDGIEAQLTLAKIQQSLEAHRHQLIDGQPCPLCGALDHPFKKESPINHHELAQRLHHAKVEKNKLEQQWTCEIQEITKHQENLKTQQDALESIKSNLAQEEKQRAQYQTNPTHLFKLQSLNLQDTQAISTLKSSLQAQLSQVEQQLKQVNSLSQQWQKKSEEHQAVTQQHTAQKLELVKVQAQLNAQEHAYRNSQQQLNDKINQHENDWHQLQADFSSFGMNGQQAGLEQDFLDLQQREQKYRKHIEKKSELTLRLTTLSANLDNLVQQEKGLEREYQQLKQTKENDERSLSSVQQTRLNLFGKKDCDQEQASMAAVLAQRKQIYQEKSDLNIQLQAQLSHLQSSLSELNTRQQEQNLRLQQTESEFTQRLMQKNFSDEISFQQALLPEATFDALKKEKAHIEERLAFTQGQIQTLIEKQQTLTDTAPTQSLNELQTLRDAAQNRLDELSQALGRIHTQIEQNQANQQKHQQLYQALQAQQEELKTWALLHDLIGSADGKKYRHFAQGISLEILIDLANQQLQHFNDRYILKTSDTLALGLEVIDNYQGAQIRSVKNLSGGESFIISLALALGLSQLSSQKNPIDTLFLDEGFGTLDEQALETALEALSNLQQNGKLIGIISHVPSLKERIQTQILVTPLQSGRSQLQGPGIQHKRQSSE